MKTPKKTIKLNQGDVVLQEVYRIKDELSASYGHDLDRLFEETRKHEKASIASGWKFVPLPQPGNRKRAPEETTYALHDKPAENTVSQRTRHKRSKPIIQ